MRRRRSHAAEAPSELVIGTTLAPMLTYAMFILPTWYSFAPCQLNNQALALNVILLFIS